MSEAWEALIGDATSRNAADGEKGEHVSLRTANAATADGVGEESGDGDGDAAPRRIASGAMATLK